MELLRSAKVSTPRRSRSFLTKSPNRSSPTLPTTRTLRPSRRRQAAVLAAHPPALSRYRSTSFSSPAAGRESIGLAKMSTIRMPRQTTSIVIVLHRVPGATPALRAAGQHHMFSVLEAHTAASMWQDEVPRRRHNSLNGGHEEVFHDRGKRNRRVWSCDAPNRRVQIPDASVCYSGRNLRSPPAGEVILLNDHQPSSLADRFENGRPVKRHQGASINHLGIDAVVL